MSEQKKSNKVFTQGTSFRVIDANRKTSDVTGEMMEIIQGDSLITNLTLSTEQVNELIGKIDAVLQANPGSSKVQITAYTSIRQGGGKDFLSSNLSVTPVVPKDQGQQRTSYAPKQYGNKSAVSGAEARASRVRREIGG
jgi:hypothetical protein